MSSRVITPGPYRATKLWNEVTRLFRDGMPLKKHRQNFRHHSSCFTASAAVDWLHQLLCSNNNFGPDVTRQQTVQLLKKFLKNHVIEDVKGRWGTEELEDNNALYRFPPTSPLKPIPCPAPGSSSSTIKKRPSLRDFRFRSVKKSEKETVENVDPALPVDVCETEAKEEQQRRELTVEDELVIWRDITLTHLQRILRVSSLRDVLDPYHINPQNIIHNMTKVNKHGVVTLEDKTNDLPHWVLSAMKSLANWPKYDSAHPSYPGFERDVFKTVSDYFYSLPQPLLTYQLYELFINVLVFSGYIASAKATQPLRKRKIIDPPCVPPPSKASFRSTECLLLSLLRHGTCDEADSPMKDVIGGKLQSRRLASMRGSVSDGEETMLGGSCVSLSTVASSSVRPPTRSCSLDTVLDDDAPLTRQRLFPSTDSLASHRSHSDYSVLPTPPSHPHPSPALVNCDIVQAADRLSSSVRRRCPARPRSIGSCLDIVVEGQEEEGGETKMKGRAASCLNINAPDYQRLSTRPPSLSSAYHLRSSSSHPLSSSSFFSAATKACSAMSDAAEPRPTSSTFNLCTLDTAPVVHRCCSSLDISKAPRHTSLFKAAVFGPKGYKQTPQTHQVHPQHSVLQPQCERVAIEALQLCTLLLPPSSRRKLQLLMRMMSRISQNVDMPRLHPAIGTRTLMVHTFSCCVLGSAEECELDELLATRLVSFLMDHQHSILSVPEYLLSAISDHILYLRTAQVPVDCVSNAEAEEAACVPVPMYAFCHQISGPEFEQQKLEASQQALEELLEILLKDENLSQKERTKKLKQFQKQYPDIYRRRFPLSEGENKTEKKPKIKPALLSLKKTKAFSLRN